MPKHLIKQGQKYSVKVPIPTDVQHVFGKKAFKKSLKTSDAVITDARKGPLVIGFKKMIKVARGNPTTQLDDYLKETARYLSRQNRRLRLPMIKATGARVGSGIKLFWPLPADA